MTSRELFDDPSDHQGTYACLESEEEDEDWMEGRWWAKDDERPPSTPCSEVMKGRGRGEGEKRNELE